jgi:hypothetical protein
MNIADPQQQLVSAGNGDGSADEQVPERLVTAEVEALEAAYLRYQRAYLHTIRPSRENDVAWWKMKRASERLLSALRRASTGGNAPHELPPAKTP